MHAFDWIEANKTGQPPCSNLSGLIPDVFDKYFLVPWITGIIDSFPFAEYPENNYKLADLNKQIRLQHEAGIFLNTDTEYLYRETTLRELAERFRVPYGADTAELIKSTPGISTLYTATMRMLSGLLHALPHDSELHLHVEFDDYCRWENGNYEEWNQVQNTLTDASLYFSFRNETGWDTTSCLFPENRTWCLCTIEGFSHFILCCNASAYKSLQALDGLETFEVRYDFQTDKTTVVRALP
jgi:hypothetical protein